MVKKDLFREIKSKFKHGVLVYGILNRMARYGIEVMPYYWEKEFVKNCEPPLIKGNTEEYYTEYIGEVEIRRICEEGRGYRLKEKLRQLEEGGKCMALFHKGEIVAYSWIELNSLTFRCEEVEFSCEEAYLGGMHTIESYRGKNLAAFLRHKVYEVLEDEGRNTILSISDYFNKPAIRFKQKLNARHVTLHLYVKLFHRLEWNWVLKRYPV